MDGESLRASGIGLGHVRTRSAAGSGSYRDMSYPAPTTPWDVDGDPRSSIEALHHPSRLPSSEANQYMSQYLMRARASASGSLFREELGDGPGLVDPLRSSEVDLGAIVDSVMGPNVPPDRRDEPLVRGLSPSPSYTTLPGRGGQGDHSREVSGASQAPLLPPPPASTSTLSLPPAISAAQPTQPSPLQNAISTGTSSTGHGHTEESEGTEEGKLNRTRNWIERTLNG